MENEQPLLEEKKLKSALLQFIFPFSLHSDCQLKLKKQLTADGYIPFRLDHLELEDAFYGPGYRISHQSLERYYLPFTNSVIFPHEESKHGFQRYSKRLELICSLESPKWSFELHIHSVDVVLCPYDLGFITIRVELPCEDLAFTQALEVASRFRVLQNRNEHDKLVQLSVASSRFDEMEDFIFKVLVPGMLPFVDKTELEASYFEKLPFFVDECMYVQGLISFTDQSQIHEADCYRASKIDGMDDEGNAYISATNMDYIRKYLEGHLYDRWGPNTYYVSEESSFFCLTKESKEVSTALGNHMYGEYYYGVLINLFYKIVLLKLSNRYSHVQLDQNQEEIEDLIRSITTFSARYYFLEVISKSQGKELFVQLRHHLGIDELFGDVKKTLSDLYKYQETFRTKRSNYLLLILTIYTVISGIYGMNQVIEDLKAPIDWGKLKAYSIFEYIALGVTVSGICIAAGLGIATLYRLAKERKRAKAE
ncbi:hypothetical protein [Paenibacillus rigui]|uniref:Group-specific protein n=1 Tax=Paenibacillus rigui TaxID=554312 RepID=A0A229UJ84_9BACL|nr:hypothetical protein [Paenibacillus rigui]OXM83433.1 hypothetical protein CF651_25835 [Paenibacillus rigui]